MQIVTNASSNLPAALLERYGIQLVPSSIIVGGVHHDLRQPLSPAAMDSWFGPGRSAPKIIGTTAAEFTDAFRRLLAVDPEVLVVLSSKRLVGSFHSAQAATAKVKGTVVLLDSTSTDLACGLVTLAAAETARAGRSLADVRAQAEAFAAAGHFCLHVADMTHVSRSNRANLLKAWAAQLVRVRPLIGMVDGELRAIGRAPVGSDPVPLLVAQFDTLKRESPRRPVWAAVGHGGNSADAERVLAALREAFDVQFALVRPLHGATYLYSGPTALAAFVYPVDTLPFDLTPPPA